MFDLKAIVFILVFMIFQYILLITELTPYLNMTSRIQGPKFNFFKDKDNNFKYILNFGFSFGYIIFSYFLYYWIIIDKRTYLEGVIFIIGLCVLWDGCLYSMFEIREKMDIFILFYDTLIVGGLCMFISHYIFNNYFNILKNYIPILVALYLFTMACFYYKSYKYNPDLSNITFNKFV